MTKHDFIFSDQSKHRIARHFIFWFVWCLAFNLLFHFPIHVFKGWDTSGPGTKNLQELGHTLFFIKTLIVNSLFGVIVPQILLIYILINWFIPAFLLKKRNPLIVISVAVAVLLIFNFIAILFKYSPVVYNLVTGIASSIPPINGMQRVVLNDQISSLPIILGLAIMIKLGKRFWLKEKETTLLAQEKTKAELQLLKGQVHPHFLFNTLNNIYFYTLTNSNQATVMIKKLSGMLHYILNECNLPEVNLEKEIKMILEYMALEKIRYAERLDMSIDIEDNMKDKMIAPLLLIPFVENSFKHGASKMITQPWIKLNVYVENNWLYFTINNSKPPTNEPSELKGNIGLKNVIKRLELLYPGTHELTLISEPEFYAVYLKLQLLDMKDHSIIKGDIKQQAEYALA